ncbi:MAG: hypothetical protein KatS3mg065_0853 [Chloroflexota bacterium]|nr:MAG: hypothetical protein KatS3mg065_0853 [Chloroflexota bacterium]
MVALRSHLRPWSGLVPYVRGAVAVLELPAGTIAETGTAVGDVVVVEGVGGSRPG